MVRAWLAGVFLALAGFFSPAPVPKERPLEKYSIV
jgi:hypothetical protein